MVHLISDVQLTGMNAWGILQLIVIRHLRNQLPYLGYHASLLKKADQGIVLLEKQPQNMVIVNTRKILIH